LTAHPTQPAELLCYNGDCGTAIALYDRAVAGKGLIVGDTALDDIERARQQCQTFLDITALQEAGKPGDALLAYDEFIALHPGSPLLGPARTQAHALWTSAGPEAMAGIAVCGKLDRLLQNDVVPDRNANLPLIYAGCGQVYVAAGENSRAVAVLQQLGLDFPDHPLREQLEPQRSVDRSGQSGAAGRKVTGTKFA